MVPVYYTNGFVRRAFIALAVFPIASMTRNGARADIFRWDNGQLIPGTEGITPGQGIDLSNWSTPGHQLEFANLSNYSLRGSNLANSDLISATFVAGVLVSSNFSGANLGSANLSKADLNGANLSNANLTGASIAGANLAYATYNNRLTAAQLYSTGSYAAKNLAGILFWHDDLAGWDFRNQDLSGADFYATTLVGTDFTGALIARARFDSPGSPTGFTKEQFYSTASYAAHDLTGINLNSYDLTGWDFSYQDLTGANFTFSGGVSAPTAILTNANITGANLSSTLFNSAQLYSTANYLNRDLHGIKLSYKNLTGWSFSNQNLVNVWFVSSTLTNADFTNADLRGVVGFVLGAGTVITNAIFPDGTIQDLHVEVGPIRSIRFSSLAVKVMNSLSVTASSPGVYTAKLDLTDNKLILQSTGSGDKATKIGDLNAAISAGSNGATWTGNGITSSSAANDANHYGVGLFDNAILQKTSFGGQPTDTNSILITIAHLGDTNGNGVVDIQDLTIVANNWQQARNNWAQGDLSRDGIVDIQDLTIVANNWQKTSIYSLEPEAGLQITNYGLPASVPEPGALVALAPVLLGVYRRRRRRE